MREIARGIQDVFTLNGPDGRLGSSPFVTPERDVPPGFPFIPGVPGNQEVPGKEDNKDGRRRSVQPRPRLALVP